MNNSIFITGTDTDIGKTFVSIGFCLALENKGLKVGYFKPFQSGAKNGIAPDIEELKKYSNSIETKYSYLFEGDVSPHLASILGNIKIDINKVKNDLIEYKGTHPVDKQRGDAIDTLASAINFLKKNIDEILNCKVNK